MALIWETKRGFSHNEQLAGHHRVTDKWPEQGGEWMGELVHARITEKILGAAFAVHSALGPGFLEAIYEEALSHELTLRGVQFQRQVNVPVHYKGIEVGTHVMDLLVSDQVVVELKAITELADVHKAIVLSYLATTQRSVALLINFGQPSLTFKRIVRQSRTS